MLRLWRGIDQGRYCSFLPDAIKLAEQEEITPLFSKKVRILRHKKLDKSMRLC